MHSFNKSERNPKKEMQFDEQAREKHRNEAQV